MQAGRRSWKRRCATGLAVFFLALGGARGAAAQEGSPLFQETARLTPAGAAGLELHAATLSGDGNRALLGFGGVAFVFVRTAAGWVEEARLDPPAGAPNPPEELFQSFGSAVALSGDGSTALVGGEAPCASTPSGFCQAAWVFVRQGGVWSEQGALPISHEWSPANSRRFVDISADGATALVGAPCFGTGDGPPCDAALVFVRSGTTWSVQGTLLVPSDSQFGAAVALSDDGNLALFGGSGFQVHAFARMGGTWSALQVLEPDLASPDRFIQFFGAALDLSSDGAVALVGDPRAICGGFELGSPCGSAFFFQRAGGFYTNVQAYEDGDDFESNGSSVALSGDGSLALITQPGAGLGEGVTKVLLAVGGGWIEVQELAASESLTSVFQGGFAALSRGGHIALVGNVVFEQASVAAIPTASELGLALLALLVGVTGAALLARSRLMA